MESIRTLLVFCEGPHDIAFCNLVFKCCLNFRQQHSWKFSEYPAPLNQLFKASMEKHAKKDLQLDMAHKFFLPDKTLCNDGDKCLILLFNTGGKEKVENPKDFLFDFLPLLKNASIFPGEANRIVSDCRYLFLYDRDSEPLPSIFSRCKKNFSSIGDEAFISEDFKNIENSKWSATCMNNTVGIHVFSSPDSDSGTLEDILLPMFEQSKIDLVARGIEFIDQCFEWHTKDTRNERKVAEIAKRKKAIITVIGQRKKPGSSMNVIVDQAQLISKVILEDDDNVKELVRLINTLLVHKS